MSTRVLILAESCNPEWPSLPVVGYKYARASAGVADVTVATHVRNRPNIEKAGELGRRVRYIDNEWIAANMYRLAKLLRGGNQVAWSTNQMMAYLPYLEFERLALKAFRGDLAPARFDLVHRITPMSPTLPSYIAGKTRQPFVIGPLNGNLDWPAAFAAEQKREREGLAAAPQPLPRPALCPLDLSECGVRPGRLPPHDRRPAGGPPRDDRSGPRDRLRQRDVPCRAAACRPSRGRRRTPSSSSAGSCPTRCPRRWCAPSPGPRRSAATVLRIVGDGPEEPRLRAIVAEAGAEDRVIFEGRKTQAEVAEIMRDADAFVFPSIRELGAGVVIEAMACGLVTIVTDYGAPGDLAANGRGVRVPLQPMEGLVALRPRRDGGLPRRPDEPPCHGRDAPAATPSVSTTGTPRRPIRGDI